MPGRIAVGVDGSEESMRAVDWAADEAALRNAELRLVNASLWQEHALVAVRPSRDVLAARAQDLLDTMTDRARSRHSGITTSEEEIEDAPDSVLVSASADADLVVLGSYGSGAGYTVGSVGQEVTAEAHSPVVLVRGSKPDKGGRVVVGLDIRSPGEELLQFAFDFAARRSVPVHVLHTWGLTALHHPMHPHGEGSKEAEAGRAALSEAVRPYRERFPQVEVQEEATAGRAAGRLVEAAAGAGITVVGRRRGRQRLGHLGAVAHAVLHHADCPVAVVPHA
ncbi:universal stress protein [Streptomyces sp. NPDC001435]|uniref:universal stress protein n=1 Tax=unclassified Streptomyces TaxID=2593676 RepID=UPI0036916CEC